MKQIAVLLTVFNRKEKTLLCLKNLYQQTLPNEYRIDIYLTNDGCTDGTPEAVKEQYPQVNIINAQGNLYWNRGMHLAWQTATQTNATTHLNITAAANTAADVSRSHLMPASPVPI